MSLEPKQIDTPAAFKGLLDRVPYWSPGMSEFKVTVRCVVCGAGVTVWNWFEGKVRCPLHIKITCDASAALAALDNVSKAVDGFRGVRDFRVKTNLDRIGEQLTKDLDPTAFLTQPFGGSFTFGKSLDEFFSRCESCQRDTYHCAVGHCQVDGFYRECGACLMLLWLLGGGQGSPPQETRSSLEIAQRFLDRLPMPDVDADDLSPDSDTPDPDQFKQATGFDLPAPLRSGERDCAECQQPTLHCASDHCLRCNFSGGAGGCLDCETLNKTITTGLLDGR